MVLSPLMFAAAIRFRSAGANSLPFKLPASAGQTDGILVPRNLKSAVNRSTV